MSRSSKKRWRFLGAAIGGGATLALVVGLGVLAGVGAAASKAAPTNISPPTISGTPREGQVLTGDRGNWSGAPTDYNYNWMRCDKNGSNCKDIGGAHDPTYTLTSDDVNQTIRLQVEAKNADGSTKATSSATDVVAPSPPQNTSPPTISGTPRQGEKLSGDRGKWSGKVDDYNDSWLRCDKNGGDCSTIADANDSRYVLTSADVGHTIRYRVEAKNASGSNTASSVPTAVIVTSAKAPVNKSVPTISGTPAVGQVLTLSVGKWKESPTSYKYQWLRCDTHGGGCVSITGAFGRTWRVLPASVGHTIRARVTASNAGGSAQATSAPTGVVGGTPAPAPPPPTAGCPGGGGPVAVAAIGSPARLLIDGQKTTPPVVHRGTRELVVRYHVSACHGRSVQGALVYATAVPFNQLTVPSEQRTNSAGWAEIHFRMLRGFPVSSKQQLIAVFVRARKSGENVLGGISTRRLFSVAVNLHG